MKSFSVICIRICGKSDELFSYLGYSVTPDSTMEGFDCTIPWDHPGEIPYPGIIPEKSHPICMWDWI